MAWAGLDPSQNVELAHVLRAARMLRILRVGRLWWGRRRSEGQEWAGMGRRGRAVRETEVTCTRKEGGAGWSLVLIINACAALLHECRSCD